MPDPRPEPRSLTVDAALRRRMARDLWLHNLRTLRGAGLVRFVVAGAAVWLVWHHLLAALAVVLVLVLGRVAWWWWRLTANLGSRLPTGQVISVGHTAGGDLVIRDTDEVWLPRGSATTVERIGTVTVVHGRGVGAIVPTSLLTAADAAFLEGHGSDPVPHAATDAAPDLPLHLVLDEHRQDDLVAARRRSYLRSGEFGIVVFLPVLVFAVMVTVARPLTTLVVTGLLAIPVVIGLSTMQRSCRALRQAYPVGHELRANVDEDGMLVTMLHGVVRLPWSRFDAHRLRPRTVELRTRKGRPLANVTLPLELFTPEALQVLRTHVPTSF